MLIDLVPRLSCPACRADRSLTAHAFEAGEHRRIRDGVLVCEHCRAWYSIDNDLLELVPAALVDARDMARFYIRWRQEISALGLRPSQANPSARYAAQLKQRQHFDWYADNEDQQYVDYAKTPFWASVDELTFRPWCGQVSPGTWLLDIGCANGRSSFPLVASGATIAGCDISKKMLRQAIEQAAQRGLSGSTSFFVADGNDLPLAAGSFEYALTYGVLHHLPDPRRACQKIQQILKPGGVFFASENNKTIFRRAFDLLMKVKPLWTEEAGREPLISRQMIDDWHAGLAVDIHSATRVFVPPHILNLAGQKAARRLLALTDSAASRVPGLSRQGGLIVFEIRKREAAFAQAGGNAATPSHRAAAA